MKKKLENKEIGESKKINNMSNKYMKKYYDEKIRNNPALKERENNRAKKYNKENYIKYNEYQKCYRKRISMQKQGIEQQKILSEWELCKSKIEATITTKTPLERKNYNERLRTFKKPV